MLQSGISGLSPITEALFPFQLFAPHHLYGSPTFCLSIFIQSNLPKLENHFMTISNIQF